MRDEMSEENANGSLVKVAKGTRVIFIGVVVGMLFAFLADF